MLTFACSRHGSTRSNPAKGTHHGNYSRDTGRKGSPPPHGKDRGHAERRHRAWREDVSKVEDPHARALFETTAEVLTGLVKAYEHFDQRSEQAWRTP